MLQPVEADFEIQTFCKQSDFLSCVTAIKVKKTIDSCSTYAKTVINYNRSSRQQVMLLQPVEESNVNNTLFRRLGACHFKLPGVLYVPGIVELFFGTDRG